MSHICHQRVRQVVHLGIEVPGQQGMALKGCRLCQCLKTHLSRSVTLLSRNAGLGWNVADAYSSGTLTSV